MRSRFLGVFRFWGLPLPVTGAVGGLTKAGDRRATRSVARDGVVGTPSAVARVPFKTEASWEGEDFVGFQSAHGAID